MSTKSLPLITFFSKSFQDTFCSAGINSLTIDDNGDVWPCHRYISNEKYNMGNIFQSSELDEINTKFSTIKEELLSIRKDKINECNQCIAQFWCEKCIGSYLGKNKPIRFEKKSCDKRKLYTKLILDNLSSYVKNGKFNLLNKQISSLIMNGNAINH